ncbi:lysophospholipid acyltransferase 7 [Diabrotica virgifera virgifera]|uniref:Lysophospholipid acyltransferase 7 n=1 Tax=Diabrotica virgifera virgifera TaxID=50390 RepID=A0A6P7FLU6_DIAVI|nr:lysophospholipid acyltransferase 7 [Diabrotica virgifera virgifera]
MNTDDIIYLGLIFFQMGFGFYYRTINNVENKKLIGAAVGLAIAVVVSGFHVLHVLISTLINACIILFIDKRKCHVYSFVFSFLYLMFFRTTAYFGIPYAPGHTNLVQMMLTLKLVGLACEVNTSFEAKKKKDESTKTEEQEYEDERLQFKISFTDIFCYTFNYCGVLTGPYFRYVTYLDHLYKPYYKYDNIVTALKKRIHWIPILGAAHLITNYYWPLSYVSTEEFLDRSFFYRAWYVWPSFLIFRSRIYFGLVLTEIVCIFGGLGVYPEFAKAKSGHGPTQNYKKLKETTDPEVLKGLEYDYETIQSINPYESDWVPTMREAMKHWNITIQYWLATYIYRKFPYKKYRTHVTMFMSALWHGVYAGYYFCIATVPFALLYEDVWVKLLLDGTEGVSLQLGKLLLLFLKMQMFSYQSISFVLLEIRKIMNYYNCVYHWIPIVYVGIYFLGKHLLKLKRQRAKKAQAEPQIDIR